jgi:hypothetical protein
MSQREKRSIKLDEDMAKLDSARKKYTDKPRVLIVHFGQANNRYFILNRRSAQPDVGMGGCGECCRYRTALEGSECRSNCKGAA